MQTPASKARRPGSLEVPQKKSPATPRTARKLKTESDSASSPNQASKTPRTQSPKVTERRTPRSPANEIQKKRPSRIPELESQVAQIQEELKRAKEQVNTSESLRRQAQQEAEETKKQLATMSAKLEESLQQLEEITSSEDSRINELRKLSQERDKAWQSELEAVQKHHEMDSAAMANQMNEMQRLKAQLEKELSETLPLVSELRAELENSKESEAQAREIASEMEKQLEMMNATLEMLRSDEMKAGEAYDSMSMELERSKAQVRSLEELVKKLEEDREKSDNLVEIPQESEEMEQLKEELNLARTEISQLRSALDAAETRYHEEYIQSTLQIRSAYEQVETVKSESSRRQAAVEAELKKTKAEMEDLREQLIDKEAEMQGVARENKGLNSKIEENEGLKLEMQDKEKESELGNEMKKLEADLGELKANLMDKEMELQSVTAQNETLKMEIEKMESEKDRVISEAVTKLGDLTEEADKSSRRAEHVVEQLGAAQATNTELEAELRRLKVQCDQWRKAAEAAAAMLSGGNNGKYVERTGSLDIPLSRNMNSPYMDDTDDDSSPKKKNGNMLKKIGVLLKKGQK